MATNVFVPDVGVVPCIMGGLGVALFTNLVMVYYYGANMHDNWDLQCGREYFKEEKHRARQMKKLARLENKNKKMEAEMGR